MSTKTFFDRFFQDVKKTSMWKDMADTVEGSEYHREANVAVHTEMCIDYYLKNISKDRDERSQILTLIALLFHDISKPEAEETIMRDGAMRHRYAGHESMSANSFLSFMCDNKELTFRFFAEGYDWNDVRKIKFMIEHHLPYGLKNVHKRANMKRAVQSVLGSDEQCFYDMLISDCSGRISDDHETKKKSVNDWIQGFKDQEPAKPIPAAKNKNEFFVLVGPVGAGKSTWTEKMVSRNPEVLVVSEDEYRVQFYNKCTSMNWDFTHHLKSEAEKYSIAWKYCSIDHPKEYNAFVLENFESALNSGKSIILDRTNGTRKGRSRWIEAAKQKGFFIQSVEFYVSEKTSQDRQMSRGDKVVPADRVHQMYYQFDVPMSGVEVHGSTIIPPW